MLTKKQRDFIAAYVECWHITNAAITAGYSKRSAYSIGSENLKNPEILAAIEAHVAAIMPKGEVLARLAEHARSTADDFLTIERVTRRDMQIAIVKSDDGEEETRFVEGPEYEVLETRLDLEKTKDRGKLHLLKEYKVDKDGAITVKWHDSQAALALLGRHHKLFVDKVEHSGPDGGPIDVTSAAMDAAAKELETWRKQMTDRLSNMPSAAPTPPTSSTDLES